MTLRVKSDKEYAALLLSMTQQTEKQEAADYVSTVSKVRGLTCSFSPDVSDLVSVSGPCHTCTATLNLL